MPVKPVRRKVGGKLKVIGYRYGTSGKLYPTSKYGPTEAKRRASRQGRAIHAKR